MNERLNGDFNKRDCVDSSEVNNISSKTEYQIHKMDPNEKGQNEPDLSDRPDHNTISISEDFKPTSKVISLEDKLADIEISDDDVNYNALEDEEACSSYIPSKNELLVNPNIPKRLEANENSEMLLLGKILYMLPYENAIMVSNVLYNEVVDLDSNVYCKCNGFLSFGYIDDIIGQTNSWSYVVKLFPDLDKSRTETLQNDVEIYFDKSTCRVITLKEIMSNYKKGTDASNVNDEEVSENEMDFSDDEMEIQHKKNKKNASKQKKMIKNESKVYKKEPEGGNASNNMIIDPFNPGGIV